MIFTMFDPKFRLQKKKFGYIWNQRESTFILNFQIALKYYFTRIKLNHL